MISPTDLFHPPPAPHFKTFQVFLIYCPKRPSLISPPQISFIIIFVNNQLVLNSFSCMFVSILYIFRADMRPSSGELIVSIRHLVYVTLYRWPFGVQVWKSLIRCKVL